jgi:hypothetical protein
VVQPEIFDTFIFRKLYIVIWTWWGGDMFLFVLWM